jgi:hypothetical protein
MNFKECGKNWTWLNIKYDRGIFLEGTKETKKKSFRMMGVPVEIRSEHLPNIGQIVTASVTLFGV